MITVTVLIIRINKIKRALGVPHKKGMKETKERKKERKKNKV